MSLKPIDEAYHNTHGLTRDSVIDVTRNLFKRMRHLVKSHSKSFTLDSGHVMRSPWTQKQISENCSSTLGDIFKAWHPEANVRTDGGCDNRADTTWGINKTTLELKVACYRKGGRQSFRGCVKSNKRPGSYFLLCRNADFTAAFACAIDLSDRRSRLWTKRTNKQGEKSYYGECINVAALYKFALKHPDKFDFFIGEFYTTQWGGREIPHIGLEDIG